MADNTRTRPLSPATRINWLLDAAVFLGAVIAALSGIYFLYFVGGYQGGRNPTYGITVLFARETWDLLHTWAGVVMVAAVALHLAIHLNWIGMMTRKVMATLRGRSGMSKGARVNVVVDLVIAISFLLAAASGVYFLFDVRSGWQVTGSAPLFLWSRTTWDIVHTWSGVTLIVAAIVHLAIHWGWVTKVTARMWRSIGRRTDSADPRRQQLPQS
jgi:hypothetical protein